MRIRRRSLRKLLIAVGCVVGIVAWPGAALGGALILSGSALHLWSKGCLEQNRRLTTAGPYRWSRNPFYFANLLIDLGLCCVIGRWWVALVFVPVWFLSYRETIAREEAKLAELFPDSLPAYLEAVPTLIPTGRRLPVERSSGAFSWDNPALARGSEYARLLGVALSAMAIWAAESVRRAPWSIFEDESASVLALVVFLGAGWIVKLALAEAFRRPQTALVPLSTRPLRSIAIGGVLIVAAMTIGEVWAAALPATWFVLVALDRFAAKRAAGEDVSQRKLWRYFPTIAAGSITVCFVLLGFGRFA